MGDRLRLRCVDGGMLGFGPQRTGSVRTRLRLALVAASICLDADGDPNSYGGTGMTEAPIDDDTEITLKDACRIFFRDALKPASLRAEAKKGFLSIIRIGNKDFVTPAALREMRVRKCQENASPQGSISAKTKASGSSETDRSQYAQAAMRATAEALKKRSPRTSTRNSSQSSASVTPLPLRLPKS